MRGGDTRAARVGWWVVLFTAGCTCADAPPPPPAPRGCAPDVTALRPDQRRGMSVAHNHQDDGARGYGTDTSRATLEELRELGVGWVSLTPFGFMDGVRETTVRMPEGLRGAETDERVEREIRAAHALGLRVFLKPHVWIRGGVWRGYLDPEEGWDAFFESYGAFVLHYARMAARLGVEMLAVGVEIPTYEDAHWRALVAAVREVYDGELTYAANWDAVDDVAFWDALDLVGVQLYPPLGGVEASEEDLGAALDRHLDDLTAIARRVGRPLLLTEVGYKSIEHPEARPHEWPERHGRPRPSQEAQARAYRRLFAAVAAREEIAGLFLWKWFTDPGTDEEGDDGFSPRKKRAEAVVRSAFDARCAGE